ncbi:hypothetical protein NQ317_005006 [Molorchus minor]|uniref:Uncharacterized protein n=1 Tax=Molorchus minor TaxID=1323400 RepID=A0ABQ9K2F2_9CUCU|nr:hypothetical protein NQ317_005006 [Molorchus minor]
MPILTQAHRRYFTNNTNSSDMSKMPNKFAPLLLYLLILPIYFVILKGLADLGKNVTKTMADKVSIEQRQLGQFQLYFFTIWNFILQIIFAVTTVLDESSKLLNLPLSLQKRLGRTRAYLFNTFIFPCSLLVMTDFLGLVEHRQGTDFPESHRYVLPHVVESRIAHFHNSPGDRGVVLTKEAPFRRVQKSGSGPGCIYDNISIVVPFRVFKVRGVVVSDLQVPELAADTSVFVGSVGHSSYLSKGRYYPTGQKKGSKCGKN